MGLHCGIVLRSNYLNVSCVEHGRCLINVSSLLLWLAVKLNFHISYLSSLTGNVFVVCPLFYGRTGLFLTDLLISLYLLIT